MQYYEATIHTSRAGIEFVTAMLDQIGITEVSINDPKDIEEILDKKEGYEWDYIDEAVLAIQDMEPTISAYFEDSQKGQEKLHALYEAVAGLREKQSSGQLEVDVNLGSLHIEDKIVREDTWRDKWKEYFKPSHITDAIVVKPSWEVYDSAPDETVIELDPGMAFGTGTHETTSSCIKLMEKYMGDERRSSSKSVLDIGCGSGILSIAAALLGSDAVLGVEIDPIAVTIAKENVAKNKVQDVVRIVLGDLTKGIDFKADMVVANLTIDLIRLLARDIKSHLKEGGIFICSGILVEKREEAVQVIRHENFQIIDSIEDGEWCAIASK